MRLQPLSYVCFANGFSEQSSSTEISPFYTQYANQYLRDMPASTLGLIIEIVLFALGLYLYLFARGIISFGSDEAKARAEAFRKDNAIWMRLLGLALAAIMAMNIGLHIKEMMA